MVTTIIMATMICMIMTMLIKQIMKMAVKITGTDVAKKRATSSAQKTWVKMQNSVMSLCLLSSFDIESGSSKRFLLRVQMKVRYGR